MKLNNGTWRLAFLQKEYNGDVFISEYYLFMRLPRINIPIINKLFNGRPLGFLKYTEVNNPYNYEAVENIKNYFNITVESINNKGNSVFTSSVKKNHDVNSYIATVDKDHTALALAHYNGVLIGTLPFANHLIALGITEPEMHNVNTHGDIPRCNIGYSKKYDSWSGWSYNDLYHFKVGSTVTKGDIAYVENDPIVVINDVKEHYGRLCDLLEVDMNVVYNSINNSVKCKLPQAQNVDELSKGLVNGERRQVDKDDVNFELTDVEFKMGRGEWTATTLDDAKLMAMDYANQISSI
jgi:hypothetical protein